jgi:fatty-acyl-CoA synthase
MNGPLYIGNTVVLLPRWDRDARRRAACSATGGDLDRDSHHAAGLLSNPKLSQYDLSSLRRLSGGGAAMPAAVAQRLEKLGVPYF